MKKLFLYTFAVVYAAIDCLRGEWAGQILDDGPDLHVQYFEAADEPVLMFIDKCRPIAEFLVGGDMEEELRTALLDKCWEQYREERRTSETNLGFYVHKPNFLQTFRCIINEEQRKREAQQLARQEAQDRAEQVRKWLNAGADVNTAVQKVPDRPYNRRNGYTALWLAKAFNEEQIIEVLREYSQEQQVVLLRAPAEGQETLPEQLKWAVNGQE